MTGEAEMEHTLHTCNSAECVPCAGGLALCNICNGAEASLPTDCPGRPLSAREEDAILANRLDFVRDPDNPRFTGWIHLRPHEVAT